MNELIQPMSYLTISNVFIFSLFISWIKPTLIVVLIFIVSIGFGSIGAVAYVSDVSVDDDVSIVVCCESSSKWSDDDDFESSFAINVSEPFNFWLSIDLRLTTIVSFCELTDVSLVLSCSSIIENCVADIGLWFGPNAPPAAAAIDDVGRTDARPNNGSKRSKMELRQLFWPDDCSPFDNKKSKSDGFKITAREIEIINDNDKWWDDYHKLIANWAEGKKIELNKISLIELACEQQYGVDTIRCGPHKI